MDSFYGMAGFGSPCTIQKFSFRSWLEPFSYLTVVWLAHSQLAVPKPDLFCFPIANWLAWPLTKPAISITCIQMDGLTVGPAYLSSKIDVWPKTSCQCLFVWTLYSTHCTVLHWELGTAPVASQFPRCLGFMCSWWPYYCLYDLFSCIYHPVFYHPVLSCFILMYITRLYYTPSISSFILSSCILSSGFQMSSMFLYKISILFSFILLCYHPTWSSFVL